MFDINDLLKMGEERKKAKGEAFLETIRKQFLDDSEENVSMIYSRDKHTATFKLCKMKSGCFSIIDKGNSKTLFSCDNLHEAKVEFITMQSLTTDIGARIFEAATR